MCPAATRSKSKVIHDVHRPRNHAHDDDDGMRNKLRKDRDDVTRGFSYEVYVLLSRLCVRCTSLGNIYGSTVTSRLIWNDFLNIVFLWYLGITVEAASSLDIISSFSSLLF